MANLNNPIDFLTFGSKELHLYEDQITSSFMQELESSTIFVLPLDVNDPKSRSHCELLGTQMSSALGASLDKVPLSYSVAGAPINLLLICLFIGNMAPESARKKIEAILQSVVERDAGTKGRVRIKHFGLFLPRTGQVTCRSYAHGQGHYYRYRLATFKLGLVDNLLREFLLSLHSSCPDEYFKSGPRASHFEIGLRLNLDRSTQHPLIEFAIGSGKNRKLKSAHEDLEKYLLERDPYTIACEVPIWLERNETDQFFPSRANSGGTLTGHIDILRYTPEGVIEIWDYKPGAEGEQNARAQVYLYALMLSTRTSIALDRFKCGYFDSSIAFFFKASEVMRAPR
jgi:hypothetical protein